MNFSRGKSEHLADHLRTAIARGELADPLPTLRQWSERLEVSSRTLQAALKILKREGWIGSRPRKGFHLLRKPIRHRRLQHPPMVRWIYIVRNRKYLPPATDSLMAISQKLATHQIGFTVEWLNDSRVGAIHSRGVRRDEMLAFQNLSLKYQERFSDFQNVLLIGLPIGGIQLPYISVDVFGALRHATFLLSRNGIDHVSLINSGGKRFNEYHQRLKDEFQRICACAPQPVQGEVVWLTNDPSEQCAVIQRLATRIRKRHGLVVNAPLSPSLIMMVLMSRGLKIPGQVEVVAMNCVPNQMRTFPPLTHYPFPIDLFSKAVCKAAIHYFERGALPMLRKNIPLTMVSP